MDSERVMAPLGVQRRAWMDRWAAADRPLLPAFNQSAAWVDGPGGGAQPGNPEQKGSTAPRPAASNRSTMGLWHRD